MNEALSDHNVDKQMTDSRGDVCCRHENRDRRELTIAKVAYLLADISNVDTVTIKDLYERLECLSCTPLKSSSK